MKKALLPLITTLTCLCLLTACGGGGGGGGSDSAAAGFDACGSLGLSAKIVDGQDCAGGPSPVVEVIIQRQAGTQSLCSGTVVTPSHVITAGHCFSRTNSGVFVRGPGGTTAVRRVTVHPEYRETQTLILNDIAILTLADRTSSPTMPILLSTNIRKGDILQIFGYGRTDQEDTAGRLRGGAMTVDRIQDTVIGAYFENGEANTCFGDSGGPALLAANNRLGLVGVTSTGSGKNCDPGELSLFADLQTPSAVAFITSVIPDVPTI